jgi:hypothetical protein
LDPDARRDVALAKEAFMRTDVTPSLVFFRLAAALAGISLVACSASEPTSSTTATGPAKTSSVAESASGSPVAALTSGGTYWFVFDESDIADAVKRDCAHRFADRSAADACVDRIRKAGDQEGFRLSGSDPTGLVWSSFGVTGGTEEVYLEVPLAVARVEGSLVEVHPIGPARGTRLPQAGRAPQKLVFEVLDARTIAMVDADKGRMVFRSR